VKPKKLINNVVELAMNKVIDIDSVVGLSEGQLQTLDTLNVSGDESVHLAKLFKRNDSSYEFFFSKI
jgi:hypothetical protein